MSARRGLLSAALLVLWAHPGIAQERTISGRALDAETGEPVANPTVSVVGTEVGAIGEADGSFTLRGVPAGRVTIRAQRIGYRTAEVPAAAGETSVEVRMRADLLQLEGLVVTGRATRQERRSVANAISTVSAAELERVPAQSVETALQGKVAGADIQKNSGAPGGGIQVNLRGVSSINAASEPLYVVDGVLVSNVAIVNNQDVVTQSSAGSNPSPLQQDQVNRIADVNPNDIESIEILKGASASAIYGSKASNGVVLITTKRGAGGPPRVNFTQRIGFSSLREKFDYRTFEGEDLQAVLDVFASESCREQGICSAADSANVIRPFESGRVFDHEEELAGRNKLSYETFGSVSGGDEDTRYYVSGTLKDDEGIVNNTGFERQSLRVNVGQELGDRWDVDVASNLIRTVARRGLFNNDNFLISPYFAFPFIPRFYDLQQRPDGTFPENPFAGGSNPLQTFELMENEEEVWRFLGSAQVAFDAVTTPRTQLRFIGRGGLDWFRQKNDLFFPPALFFEPQDGLPGTSLLSDSDSRQVNLGLDAVFTWAPASHSSSWTTSAGVQYEDRDLNISRIVSRDLTAGQPNVGSGTQIQVAERRERVEDFGFYIQEEAQFLNERLTLTAAVRGEQSSANGDTEEVFFYPKGSAAYRFLEPAGFLDELKLRVAYGESGNQPLFGQKFIELDATQNIGGEPGLTVNPLVGDPNIQPERTREIEGGFDATLFDGNATFDVTFYQQNITDLILQRTVAPSTGFQFQFFNGGELRVRGVEIGLGTTPIRRPDFVWLFRSTFALDRSKVLDLPVPAFTFGGFGTDLGAFRIEEGASATQIVGNTPNGIRKIGETNPDFKASFVNDFTYKGWNLYALLDWQKGSDIINLDTFISDLAQTTHDFVQNGNQRLSTFGTNTAVYLESASFLKLREVTLGYELPADVVRNIWGGLQRVRVSVSARDLFVIDECDNCLDPEVSNFGSQAIGRSVHTSPYPPSRSFWFTIDLGL